MKNILILILLLSSTFCSGQSPYENLLITIVDTGNTFLDNFNDDVDTIDLQIYRRTQDGEVITPIQYTPDTSLVIGTFGKAGYLSTKVNGIIVGPDMHLDRPTEYLNYIKQNKPAMKKFQYTKLRCDYSDVIKECDRLGLEGWEVVNIVTFIHSQTTDIYFKREITEQ